MKNSVLKRGALLAFLTLFITSTLYAQEPAAPNPSNLERALDRAQLDMGDLIEDLASEEAMIEADILTKEDICDELKRMRRRLFRHTSADATGPAAEKAGALMQELGIFEVECRRSGRTVPSEISEHLEMVRDEIWPPPPPPKEK